ncbi:MAG: putative transcriptional regulator [Bradyrhizobium sp.]|nr:putative transcriptional regulator [Bradyrhizobium sp.]
MTSSMEAERIELVAKALAAADDKPNAERVRIAWRTREIFATVVELPVEKVMLNPRSHRIRAQLESSPARESIETDPFTEEAQAAIAELLRGADEFHDLRANLADVGQIEPGVVTAAGLLVNANTRCVALRDNRSRYVRAAVLPSDASQEEIDRLELRLQMKRDFHSDYTFTNELLFIEDLIKQYHFTPEQIATEMAWASASDPRAVARKAEQASSYLRMLSIIREVQYMSSGKIKIVSFDSNRQALMELDDEIERLKNSDQSAAHELRNARLVGLLTGAGYRELREIGPDFLDKYLVPAMEDRPGLSPHIENLTAIVAPTAKVELTGLDILEENTFVTEEPSKRSSAALLNLLTQTVDEEVVTLTTSDGERRDLQRSYFCGELLSAIEGAAEDVRLEREAGDLLNRPRELVRKATKQTQAAIEAYREVATHPEFDVDRMRSAAIDLESACAALTAVMDEEAAGS